MQTSKSLTDFADFHQTYVSHYIQLADTKAGAVITVTGALIAYLLSKSEFLSVPPLSSAVAAMHALTLGLLALSFVFGFWVVSPRGKESSGPVYFGSVAAFGDAESYRHHLNDMSEEQLANARIDHCFALAQVCTDKYAKLRWAMLTGMTGLLLTGLTILPLGLQ